MALEAGDQDAEALFDEFLDPAIQKILDDADLIEAVRFTFTSIVPPSSQKHRMRIFLLPNLQSDDDEEGSEIGALDDGEQSDINGSANGGTTEAEDEREPSPAPSEQALPGSAAPLQHAGM